VVTNSRARAGRSSLGCLVILCALALSAAR